MCLRRLIYSLAAASPATQPNCHSARGTWPGTILLLLFCVGSCSHSSCTAARSGYDTSKLLDCLDYCTLSTSTCLAFMSRSQLRVIAFSIYRSGVCQSSVTEDCVVAPDGKPVGKRARCSSPARLCANCNLGPFWNDHCACSSIRHGPRTCTAW